MLKRIALLGAILLSLVGQVRETKAQDPEFSQFYANPLYLNPAFAGLAYCPRLIVNFRDQWPGPGLNNVYISTSASYDQHFDGIGGGIGLHIMSDNAGRGTLVTNYISGMYSYQLRLAKKLTAKAAMNVTFTQRTVDWTKLTFEDQIDPRTGSVDIFGTPIPTSESPPTDASIGYFDFHTGVLIFNDKFFGGLSVKHLTQPNESIIGRGQISRVPLRFNVHGGTVINLSKSVRKKTSELSPNIMYTQQDQFKQLNVGSYVSHKSVFAGMWYRLFTHPDFSSDAMIMVFGFKKDILKISYSYDITISQLTPGSGGSHEIALALNFCDGDNFLNTQKNSRPIECPKMFSF